MTQLLVEGFGIYGRGVLTSGVPTVRQALLSGVWSDMPAAGNPALTTLPWSPEDSAVYLRVSPDQFISQHARRALPAAQTDMIFAARFAVSALPATGNACELVRLSDGANLRVISLVLQTTGVLTLNTATSTIVGSSQTPVMVAESTHYIEMRVEPSAGEIDVYVDGEQVIALTGATMSTEPVAQFSLFVTPTALNVGPTIGYVTDIIVRSVSGDYNNSIVGDRRVATLMVNSDDTPQGWTDQPLHKIGVGILDNTLSTNNSGSVTCLPTADTSFADDDYTIEGFVRFAALPTGSNLATLWGKWSTTDNQRSYRLYKAGPTLNDGALVFQISTDGTSGTVATVFAWPWVPVTGRWYQIAISRTSGVTRLFINGVEQGTGFADANSYFTATTRTALGGSFNTGTGGGAVANSNLKGWIDEFRMTRNVGRYVVNFTPPVVAFPRGGMDPYWSDVVWLSGFESGIFDDSGFGRTLAANVGSGGGSVPVFYTPDDGDFNYQVIDKRASPLDYTFIEAALVPATGIFTLSGLPANLETVTLGSEIYEWKLVLADPNDVLIGADAGESIDNLIAAIVAGAGEGSVYGSGTTANADASAERLPSTQLLATAVVPGAAGNAISTTETTANGSWTAATLTGGADIPAPSRFGMDRLPFDATGVDSITIVSRSWKTEAGPAAIEHTFVGPAGSTETADPRNLTTTPTYYMDTFEEDPDTSGPLTVTTIISGKIQIDRSE